MLMPVNSCECGLRVGGCLGESASVCDSFDVMWSGANTHAAAFRSAHMCVDLCNRICVLVREEGKRGLHSREG